MGDIRYGFRLLRKSPGFAVVAILTLGLGIGANTAIFSTVDALLIRALPYTAPDRIVMVWEDAHEAGFPRNTPAPGSCSSGKVPTLRGARENPRRLKATSSSASVRIPCASRRAKLRTETWARASR